MQVQFMQSSGSSACVAYNLKKLCNREIMICTHVYIYTYTHTKIDVISVNAAPFSCAWISPYFPDAHSSNQYTGASDWNAHAPGCTHSYIHRMEAGTSQTSNLMFRIHTHIMKNTYIYMCMYTYRERDANLNTALPYNSSPDCNTFLLIVEGITYNSKLCKTAHRYLSTSWIAS